MISSPNHNEIKFRNSNLRGHVGLGIQMTGKNLTIEMKIERKLP